MGGHRIFAHYEGDIRWETGRGKKEAATIWQDTRTGLARKQLHQSAKHQSGSENYSDNYSPASSSEPILLKL